MRPESKSIANELLKHHREVTTKHPPPARLRDADYAKYTIPYGVLCERASVEHLTRAVGSYLLELAEWCREHGYPPLNALAVNGSTGIPGDKYDGSGGFYAENWPDDVQNAIGYQGYPETIEG